MKLRYKSGYQIKNNFKKWIKVMLIFLPIEWIKIYMPFH
jgi:hypothetical protein